MLEAETKRWQIEGVRLIVAQPRRVCDPMNELIGHTPPQRGDNAIYRNRKDLDEALDGQA